MQKCESFVKNDLGLEKLKLTQNFEMVSENENAILSTNTYFSGACDSDGVIVQD